MLIPLIYYGVSSACQIVGAIIIATIGYEMLCDQIYPVKDNHYLLTYDSKYPM